MFSPVCVLLKGTFVEVSKDFTESLSQLCECEMMIFWLQSHISNL